MIRRLFRRLRPRSAGVPVTRAAHRHIRAGDAARAGGRWAEAAAAYGSAVDLMPGLAHIWVQRAHAAKEAGDDRAAQAGYERAAALAPDDPEPHMYLGHMAKRADDGTAARHYLDALRRAPDDLFATSEVMHQLVSSRMSDAAMVDEALTLLHIDPAEVEIAPHELDLPAGTVFFDVTDLLGFLGFSRIPSGVQRVQMEVILARMAEAGGRRIALCFHSPARRGWSILPLAAFAELCRVGRGSASAAVWAHELRKTLVGCTLGADLAFPPGAILVSLGANAPNANYLLDVRTACERTGINYVPLVHDLIPHLFPQWVAASHARDFRVWLASIVHSASGFLANSEATRRDLLAHAAAMGDPVNPALTRVVRLDGQSIRDGAAELPVARLAKWGLRPGGFVLFVSTVEPRKNHLGALAAWAKLARAVPPARLPKLVCVGGRGWMNEPIYAMLAADARLRRSVEILHGVGDEELALLYRTCSFTIYPSFYEGWGLPITESLCYGKLPVVSDTSSMPEVGGTLAVYFDPHDDTTIAAAILPLVTDPGAVPAAEARIAAEFRPRTWAAIAAEIVDDAAAIAAAATPPAPPPPPAVGIRYSLALGGAEGATNGELYRHGRGWSLPDARGCRARGEDALLRFRAPAGAGTLAVAVVAMETGGFTMRGGAAVISGGLAAGERRLVAVPLAADAGIVTVAIAGDAPLLVEGFVLSG